MKLIANKRGQWPVMIAFAVAIVLAVGLFAFNSLVNNLPTSISKDQSSLSQQYSMGENVLYYLDESSRISLNEVLPDLFSNGFYSGCSEEGVGKSMGLWKNSSQTCVPSDKEVSMKLLEG